MNKRRITALFAACALLCGCGNGQTAETTTAAVTAVRTEADTTISAASPEDATAAPAQTLSLREQAEKMTAGMTLEQKIAQMITISLRRWSDTPDDPDSFVNVTELNDKQRELLKSCDFGGIVLFDPNCTDTEQTARLTAAIPPGSIGSSRCGRRTLFSSAARRRKRRRDRRRSASKSSPDR